MESTGLGWDVLLWRVFHTPAVVQQQTEQAEQDEGHTTQYSQEKHGVVHADVLREHWTCWTDKKCYTHCLLIFVVDDIFYIFTRSDMPKCVFTVNTICAKAASHLSVVGTWRPPNIPAGEQCRSDWAGYPPSARDPSCSLSRHLHANTHAELEIKFTNNFSALETLLQSASTTKWQLTRPVANSHLTLINSNHLGTFRYLTSVNYFW